MDNFRTARSDIRENANTVQLGSLLGTRRFLCLGSMGRKEKNSRDEPKELWIHGRAYLWAMDMPQSKTNENRYFWGAKAR